MPEAHKRVIMSVINDLATDQRVHRTAMALHRKGLKVTLVGRMKKDSLPLGNREYDCMRFRLWWEKGPLFYAAYNTRLFFYLLFHPTEILVANDLDTLPANYFISKFRKVKLYYDSHEIFTEVPELVSRPRVQRIWKRIEKWILPGIQKMYTVNESIAGIYSREYTKVVGVVRNVPFRRVPQTTYADRKSLGLPEDKTIFIFQGAGINVHRGAEEVLAAMQYTEGILLLFVGSGDVIDFLKAEQKRLGLEDKVLFVSRQPMEKLRVYTSNSDFGLSLDKDSNLNYRYSLPNKLFDYIQAEIPVLASDLPEIRKIVDGYSIGEILRSHEPRAIADQMMQLAGNSEMRAVWKANLKKASEELCWENEVNRLYEIYKDVI